MIRIGILGDIGSGKSFFAKQFGYPIFDADREVVKLYKKSRKCYNQLKKKLPNYITSFPIRKKELSKAIIANRYNLKKISKIVHPEINKIMKNFTKKNKNKKFIVLDVPLLLENKINNKNDVLVFIEAKKKLINKQLRKRKNLDRKMLKELKRFQLPVEIKKKRSDFIIKNNFKINSAKKNVKRVVEKILLNA